MYSDMAYRRTAVQGSSGFGLLIAIFDNLAGDLRRAAEAERNNDLEKRCREANHAVQVIGFLEDRLLQGDGGPLADQMHGFYRALRRKLMQAQVNRSAKELEDLMNAVLKIREAWHKADQRQFSAGPYVIPASVPSNLLQFVAAGADLAHDEWFA